MVECVIEVVFRMCPGRTVFQPSREARTVIWQCFLVSLCVCIYACIRCVKAHAIASTRQYSLVVNVSRCHLP